MVSSPGNFRMALFFLRHPVFKPSSTFKIAQFEANFHAMTVSTSNCWTVNKKLLTRPVKTEAIENFGKEKVKKTVSFLDKTFFLGNFLYF